MESKIKKLPKWAQEHITRIERISSERERVIKSYIEQQKKTRITTDVSFNFKDVFYIPDQTPLYINVGGLDNPHRYSICVSVEQERSNSDMSVVKIRASNRGEFYVKPRASNAVDIVLLED